MATAVYVALKEVNTVRHDHKVFRLKDAQRIKYGAGKDVVGSKSRKCLLGLKFCATRQFLEHLSPPRTLTDIYSPCPLCLLWQDSRWT